MSDKIIRAIDLGYNGTKYTKDVVDGNPVFDVFPSVAPAPPSVDVDGGFDLHVFDERDTVTVDINGVKFEVGPDSLDIQQAGETRVLHDQYIHSDQYMALTLGAFYYMDVDVIDILVVGLPVNSAHLSKELASKLTGTHKINDEKTVEVKKVLVIPQAYGGFRDFYNKYKENDQLFYDEEETTLMVDPGYYTFDFFMLKGFDPAKPLNKRCGSKEGGIHQILKGIGSSISTNVLNGKVYENYEAIDKALRRKDRKIRIAGEIVSLDEHIKNTSQSIESVVDYMKNIVGDGVKENIDNIVLIGGNPLVYKKTIESKFPELKEKGRIFVPEGSIFSNVSGYYDFGVNFKGK